jgi:hypothetical protein
VVGTARPHSGNDSTPTFSLRSENFDDYRPRVLTLKERRPHKAPDLDEVSRADLEDLAAYIGRLERP